MTTTTNTTDRQIQIAQSQTIANQIGRGALFMIGAKHLCATQNAGKAALSFAIMRNAERVTHIMITLEPSDVYTVEFINCRGVNRKVLHTSEMVYSDSLNTCIEAHTGLRLSL
jgi:hypothetical protein